MTRGLLFLLLVGLFVKMGLQEPHSATSTIDNGKALRFHGSPDSIEQASLPRLKKTGLMSSPSGTSHQLLAFIISVTDANVVAVVPPHVVHQPSPSGLGSEAARHSIRLVRMAVLAFQVRQTCRGQGILLRLGLIQRARLCGSLVDLGSTPMAPLVSAPFSHSLFESHICSNNSCYYF
jgi:hypothetical protein